MTFQFVNDLAKGIIKTIEQTAVLVVKALKLHTFKTKIGNFPKTQGIKGAVVVSNQKKVESGLRGVRESIQAVLKVLKSFKFPKEMRITNLGDLPKFPAFPKFPKKIEISNLTKIPPYPKEMKISNPQTKELSLIVTAINALGVRINKLKLDPKINVQAPKPERLVIPPAKVSFTEKEIDYEKLAQTIAEQIPEIDYEKMADAIAVEMGQMVITGPSGGGGGSKKDYGSDPTNRYKAADIDTAGLEVWYYGFIDTSGGWYIMEEDKITTAYRFIKGNNSYIANWASRDSQEYDYFNEVF